MNFSAPIHKTRLLLSSPRLQRPLRIALSVLLLAILMAVLARWTWLLLPAPPALQNSGKPAATPTPSAPPPSPLTSISSTRLWGALPHASAPSVTQDTRLPLSLRGILSGKGLALIETSGKTRVYRIGDTLPGGARLHDVLIDHVLIDRAGVIERLALPRQLLGTQAFSQAASGNPDMGIMIEDGLLIENSDGSSRLYRIGDILPSGARLHDLMRDHALIKRNGVIERLPMSRRETDEPDGENKDARSETEPVELGKLLQQSPAELSKEFRLSPVTESGKLLGYRLRALRNPEILQRAGLEADDVLLSVNGTALTQAKDLPKFIKGLRSATTLDAIVLRNGREVPLHLDLQSN